MSAARAFSREKPIIVYKSGRFLNQLQLLPHIQEPWHRKIPFMMQYSGAPGLQGFMTLAIFSILLTW
jgi:hypothetical protein